MADTNGISDFRIVLPSDRRPRGISARPAGRPEVINQAGEAAALKGARARLGTLASTNEQPRRDVPRGFYLDIKI